MNGPSIVLLIIGSSLAVGLASYAVFRLVGIELRRRHLEVGTAIFLQAGVIYAVFLAFIFGQALTSYVEADNAIFQECASLHAASILIRGLPPLPRAQLGAALDTYISAVIDKEWTAMRDTRLDSPEAELAQIKLIEKANMLTFTDANDAGNQGRIVGQLLEAHRYREERIFQAGQGIPDGLWAMVLVYCGVLVVLVFFSSLEYAWSHATLSGLFGGLNVVVLLACFLLQYPFEGPFRLEPSSFVVTKARVIMTLAD